MKILILSGDFPPQSSGGAGMVAFRMAKGFQKSGHDVFVVTTVRKKTEEGNVNYEGVEIFRLWSNYHEKWMDYLGLYNPQTVKKVKQIINKIKPDIVHAHAIHFYLSYHCLKIAKKSGAKVFLTSHDVMLFSFGKLMGGENYKISTWRQFRTHKLRYNPLRNAIIRHYLKYVDKIFAVSYALKKALAENGIKNVEVVYNAIDAEQWLVGENFIAEFKSKFNLQNRKIIFFGGRISEAKGGEVAVRALERVVKNIPDAVLLVVGTKNNFSKYMGKTARELGVEKNLIFTGWLSGNQLKAAYWISDIVIAPSICFEAFGLTALEAMACKKPVIASCFGGLPEIVQNGVNGYVIEPHDIKLLAAKIVELLGSPEKSVKFGESGYQLAKTKFSLDAQINQTLALFSRHLRV